MRLGANLGGRQPRVWSPRKRFVFWHLFVLGDELMYTYMEISLLIVLHIIVLIIIAHYCAALPAPGLEEGVVETMFMMFLRFMGPVCYQIFLLF